MDVAPHVGAWIETFLIGQVFILSAVAPHVGAWIETRYPTRLSLPRNVAPHVGAWIETQKQLRRRPSVARRPSRRGVD